MNAGDTNMVPVPRRRRGGLFFWLMLLVVAAAIGATVLLANNKRNYYRLMRTLGIPVDETMVIPKPGSMEKFRGKRLKDPQVMLDSYVLMPEIAGLESAFLRSMRKDGESLCELFNRSGFPMSKWQPGTFSKKINECYNEKTIPTPDKPDEPSTFFLMIKGEPDGTLLSARAKIVFNTEAARAELIDMTVKMLDEFAHATNWLEIADQRGKVLSLTPFSSLLGGVSAKFSAEFSGPGRYNLIFSRGALDPAGRRTDAFFNRERFLPLPPEHGGPAIAPPADKEKPKT